MIKKDIDGPYADIAHRLRSARAYFKMTQREFSEEAGVPAKSYSQWESGDFRISISGAVKVRERFGLTLDFIYCGSLDALPHMVAVALADNPTDKASSKSKDNGD